MGLISDKLSSLAHKGINLTSALTGGALAGAISTGITGDLATVSKFGSLSFLASQNAAFLAPGMSLSGLVKKPAFMVPAAVGAAIAWYLSNKALMLLSRAKNTENRVEINEIIGDTKEMLEDAQEIVDLSALK